MKNDFVHSGNDDRIDRFEKVGYEILAMAAELRHQDLALKNIPRQLPKEEDVPLKMLLAKGVPTGCALPLFIGVMSDGRDLVEDLAALPHLLVGGIAGQGKTTLINSIICGLVTNNSPEQVRFILSDAKQVELAAYAHLPHLVMPVITETCRFVSALRWAISEVEKRLKLFARAGYSNIADFNARVSKKIPYIVIIVDEWSDLFFEDGKKLLPMLSKLTDKACVAGIHLIIATQRMGSNVIPEMLKANIPGRISFRVASSIDSRTILDEAGAENLIGKGNMLVRCKDGQIVRAHGAIIRDLDIECVVSVANHVEVEEVIKGGK